VIAHWSVPAERALRLRYGDDHDEDARQSHLRSLPSIEGIFSSPRETSSAERPGAPFAPLFSSELREWTSPLRKLSIETGNSGFRSRELGTNRGRSPPLASQSRRSRRLIGAGIKPTVTGRSVRCRLAEKDSNLTLTSGDPFLVSISSTIPGHQRPLPKRTIHTHTSAPGFSWCISEGSMDPAELVRILSFLTDRALRPVSRAGPRVPAACPR
jgi:hypothetical protein